MLVVEKEKIFTGHSFTISTDEGSFEISFQGNLDLYWRNIYHGSILTEPESKTFTITKENYYVYSLFEELYEDIKNCNVFKVDDLDISQCETSEELKDMYLKKKDLNDNIKRSEEYSPHPLFHNDIVEWHCDDFSYDESSVLKIKKEEETFIVTFEKSKNKPEDMFLTYSVRFRNSGSRYNPFNCVFMKMYNKLIEYEPEFHQVHIEELIWQKKLKKKN